jgi:Protein of unknown function (DUF2442)
MNKVIAAKANDDFSLDLKFSDDSVKRFDLKPYLHYPVLSQLNDPAYFRKLKVAFGTVQWPNGEDISPETLYLEGFSVSVIFDSDDNRHVA